MKRIILLCFLIITVITIPSKGFVKILENDEKLAGNCSSSFRKYNYKDLGGADILDSHHFSFGFWMRKGGQFEIH